MNTKIYVFILVSSFGLIILGSIVGGMLESSGTLTRENLGTRGVTIVLAIYFTLFCLAAFAAVPLVLKAFISMQIKGGNGELSIIKGLQAHEQTVVYFVWAFFAVGLCVAFVLARNHILKLLK